MLMRAKLAARVARTTCDYSKMGSKTDRMMRTGEGVHGSACACKGTIVGPEAIGSHIVRESMLSKAGVHRLSNYRQGTVKSLLLLSFCTFAQVQGSNSTCGSGHTFADLFFCFLLTQTSPLAAAGSL